MKKKCYGLVHFAKKKKKKKNCVSTIYSAYKSPRRVPIMEYDLNKLCLHCIHHLIVGVIHNKQHKHYPEENFKYHWNVNTDNTKGSIIGEKNI
jgi:hypothetical protein